MENSTGGKRVIAGSHRDGLLDERGLVVIARSPADDGLGVAVDDRRQIQTALPRRNIRYVADHLLPGRASGEIPLHAVGDAVLLAVALGEAEPPRPGLAGLQAQVAHYRAHELRPGRHAPGREVRVDPAVPVRPVRFIE